MIETIRKLDNQARFNLLSTTLGFALLALILLNLLDAIMYILLLLKEPNYEFIHLSFNDGYYAINDKKMGFSILYNFLGMVFFWILMIFHTLKSIGKPIGWNLFFNVHVRQLE